MRKKIARRRCCEIILFIALDKMVADTTNDVEWLISPHLHFIGYEFFCLST